MSSPGNGTWGEIMALGVEARLAACAVRQSSSEIRNSALRSLARRLRDDASAILSANAEDLSVARRNGAGAAVLDRLALDGSRIEAMAKGIEEIAELPDPVGRVMAQWRRPNGLEISRVATPIGVVG